APASLISRILSLYGWPPGYEDAEGDARAAGEMIARDLAASHAGETIVRAEVLRPVFYRNKGAYLVGRLVTDGALVPLVLPLMNTDRGVALDAVLLTSDEASVVFGFSRSYFFADVDRPAAVIDVLASIMPLKRVDALYTAI